ncbi:uncharacterized protein DUF4834 [Bacteroides zoogleoformans]|uniref:DUF4834 domain-containing protein n=1 Tax=Bacteroides zoogleoformans TaxID=28119 RepID=A0ABM6T940_9BACE|nr:DUF4834 family protein [Bacteroides zoogleoformans]AVM53239.1 DUF4834 domain-containing protein [Bacteroides zoogleoformans]TWJ11128.1 uncharacterized protein DUF4834 [Bacteroides zoogleoformans]
MLHFLVFLFIIVIAIVLVGLSIIGSVIRSILGLGRRPPFSASGTYQDRDFHTGSHSGYDNKQAGDAHRTSPRAEEDNLRPGRKKLFSKEEGEYVDFEEIEE